MSKDKKHKVFRNHIGKKFRQKAQVKSILIKEMLGCNALYQGFKFVIFPRVVRICYRKALCYVQSANDRSGFQQ